MTPKIPPIARAARPQAIVELIQVWQRYHPKSLPNDAEATVHQRWIVDIYQTLVHAQEEDNGNQ